MKKKKMEATVPLQVRIGPDESEALDTVITPRGKNKFVRELLRAELVRRGALKPASKAPSTK